MSSPPTPDDLNPDAVLDRLATLSARLCDLAAYIVGISDLGTITVKTFWHQPACVTLPSPTLRGRAVPDDVLARGQQAVEVLNQCLESFKAVTLVPMRAACLGRDGLADPEQTALAAHGARMDAEPAVGSLPRLTPDQILICMADLLREAADVACTFVPQDDGITVKIRRTPDPNDPRPQLGRPSPKDSLGTTGRALRQFNQAMRNGAQPPIQQV